MNVVLVRPFNAFSFSIQPPLGLGYLSASLKARGGNEVLLYDAVRHQLSNVAAFAQFLREKSPGLVGIQFYSSDSTIVREYLGCVKQIDEMTAEKVGLLARHGLKVTGLFIVGSPTETREDVLKTIALAKRLPIDRAGVASFLPLPGSRIHGELEAQGLMRGVDFNKVSYYRIAKSFTPHIPDAELSHLLKKAIRSHSISGRRYSTGLCRTSVPLRTSTIWQGDR